MASLWATLYSQAFGWRKGGQRGSALSNAVWAISAAAWPSRLLLSVLTNSTSRGISFS